MERKFMVYQRRDGFQIAEEATGTRLENGMEFLARPNKSGLWCTAAFNVVIDDDYELVGEEIIDCSYQPAQVLCFVDGVMKTIVQSRIAIEDMIELYNDAISDRNIPAARAWKIDIDAAIGRSHTEALEMDARKEMTFVQAVSYASQIEYFSMSQEEMAMAKTRDHAEALEMNKQFDKVNARHYHWWNIYTYSTRMDLLEKAHGQALEMDAKVNQALLALSSNPLSAGWYLHSPTMKEQAIRVAHIQALEMNRERDWYLERYWGFWYDASYGCQVATVSKAHAEALEMNAQLDKGITDVAEVS